MTKTKATTFDIYFDGMLKEFTHKIDYNDEHVLTSREGHVIKFPQTDNLETLIQIHNEANKKAP